ncbi:hypothetical protein [Chondromyces apiculatus]|uniref:Uncharacterized protein n=1 Tax=Chondromyces apiculatus DSM 436 TaxID=1192034 RepID=A0A017T3X7_9BACT|nr:hypothetical protein [Chondromyces apiculatus]EYF03949.1 Hypothetical protein CAP_5050 [Chondromyces apiculatus DSM 436]
MSMVRFRAAVMGCVLAAVAVGCTPLTSFTGESKVRGGGQGCVSRCQQEGLEMSAFVVMGDYSTGCVCQAPGAAAPVAPAPASGPPATSPGSPGAPTGPAIPATSPAGPVTPVTPAGSDAPTAPQGSLEAPSQVGAVSQVGGAGAMPSGAGAMPSRAGTTAAARGGVGAGAAAAGVVMQMRRQQEEERRRYSEGSRSPRSW